MQRRPVEDVTKGLETTSAKIRALANAGYNRTEIARQLGKSYQHVRNVLVNGGTSGGMRPKVEAQREPVAVEAEPAPREDTASDLLFEAGFRLVGEWPATNTEEMILDGTPPIEAGVYAFAVDGIVKYVGLTNSSLKVQLEQYRRGHERQRTNARFKKLITKSLSERCHVQVLIATPEPLEWSGLPVNTAGTLTIGDAPGLGIAILEERVSQLCVD